MDIMKYTGPADLKELEEAPPMKALLPSRSGILKVCFHALTELWVFTTTIITVILNLCGFWGQADNNLLTYITPPTYCNVA